MKKESTLFVRTDYKIGEDEVTDQVAMDSAQYLKQLSEERYLTAGVFGDMSTEIIDGAMVIFEAENLTEAAAISEADPVIKSGLYRYELKQWHVLVAADE
ncbi:YciI family protein [Candidatus Enterococcus murrayae]|uniref:YCII-related domain-containing protein n=1 Tax=Candidatus Enterococcus murrayae TaxID=2815321 RepID=A0ABS3HK78_9ENTE|nr:YciI family protein [Enterococcus sp. MJM16]MBO0453864.1 hypothetical protein [Enterococcus sp. MJM16]